MSKKEVKDIAQTFNCEALYSGNERTMYIHGVNENLAVWTLNQSYQRFSVVAGGHVYKKAV